MGQNRNPQRTRNTLSNIVEKETQDKLKERVKEELGLIDKLKEKSKELKNNPKAKKVALGVGGTALAAGIGYKSYKHYKDKKKENEIRNQIIGNKESKNESSN